eukprot:TRINITY_DN14816_c0_g1_i1.p1 TRINITY_DN14816_c0_g1~~TRINITY_DN14816_c0_g1_i1.p1  ORF type:complete len:226 (-),score=28.77 TRINITY_DN14816_c0_g1_i1:104-781(-)
MSSQSSHEDGAVLEYLKSRDKRTATEQDNNATVCGVASKRAKTELSELPRFVIHKHWATRLHYDFRLELDGVYKSWAVPKGPSLNPADRRLAVEVDDHSIEYGEFEGVIEEGYGKGVVMIWDQGTFEPVGETLREGLARGHAAVRFHGSKMQGLFMFVRLKPRPGDSAKTNWLLIKKHDEHCSTTRDLTEQFPNSATTGRSKTDIMQNGMPYSLFKKTTGGLDVS